MGLRRRDDQVAFQKQGEEQTENGVTHRFSSLPKDDYDVVLLGSRNSAIKKSSLGLCRPVSHGRTVP